MAGRRGETLAWGERTWTGPHEDFSAIPEACQRGRADFVFSVPEGELTGGGRCCPVASPAGHAVLAELCHSPEPPTGPAPGLGALV